MTTDTKKGVPGIPLQALNAIGDENVRLVLQSMVDGWHVRNGNSGDGNNRFVTVSEVEGLKSNMQLAFSNAQKAENYPSSNLKPGEIDRIINDLQASVMASRLWQELGERIKLIDDTYSLEVNGLEAELNSAAERILGIEDGTTDITIVDPITGEITTIRGVKKSTAEATAAIGEINNVSATSTSAAAKKIASTAVKMETAESNITAINDVSVTSTSANARQLAGVQASVKDPKTGLIAAHAAITALNDVSATSDSANARYLFAVNAQMAQKNRTFFQMNAPTSTESYTLRLNDIWYDSDDKNKAHRWDGSKWVESSDQRIAANAALITDERNARVNSDNAVVDAISTMWAAMGDNSLLIQSGANGLVNNAGAKAEKWDQIQVAIRDPDTGEIISSALVRTEASAALNKAGEMETKYTIKMDANGYVSGLGLLTTANNSAPLADFIVRADRFSIGSPASGDLTTPGIVVSPSVPFIVRTTEQTLPDGTKVKPGVYIDKAMVSELYGTYIYAGLLQASKIYTGSQYVDFTSKQPIPAVGSSSWKETISQATVAGNRNVGPITHSLLRFYGPYWHTNSVLASYYQRIRSSVYNGKEVAFSITVMCTTDHYLSLWYRINNGAWTFITKTVEPQPSYGFSGISCNLLLYINDDTFVDFGIFPTDGGVGWSPWGDPYDTAKLKMENLTFNVMTVNL